MDEADLVGLISNNTGWLWLDSTITNKNLSKHKHGRIEHRQGPHRSGRYSYNMLVSSVEALAEADRSDKLGDQPIIDGPASLFGRSSDLTYSPRTKPVPTNDRIGGCYLRKLSFGL